MDRDSIAFLISLAPFDPSKNKPISLPGGGQATEYTATSQDDSGKWFVHPQIWWNGAGEPVWMPGDRGRDVALVRELMGNTPLPRFDSEDEASRYAATRSAAGGGKANK